jgi:hypothetical protein
MDLVSFALSTLLFVVFVPGVLMRLPKSGSFKTVLVVHALAFAVVTSFVMNYYWTHKSEFFGNYGPTCPNGHAIGTNQGGKEDCVPVGQATYSPATN